MKDAPDRERLLELAERYEVAITFDNNFYMTDDDMKAIAFALRFTAERLKTSA